MAKELKGDLHAPSGRGMTVEGLADLPGWDALAPRSIERSQSML
jgi:hypothetical protein